MTDTPKVTQPGIIGQLFAGLLSPITDAVRSMFLTIGNSYVASAALLSVTAFAIGVGWIGFNWIAFETTRKAEVRRLDALSL